MNRSTALRYEGDAVDRAFADGRLLPGGNDVSKLPLDGTGVMTGALDMGGNDIDDVGAANVDSLYIGGVLVSVTEFSGNNVAKTYATVAGMIAAADLAVGDTAVTQGYTTAGDGGGAVYRIVAAATGTDDGGLYHDLTGITGQAELIYDESVSVKWFGATGDGVTDDAAAIQAAVDAGGRVFVPTGHYILTDEIAITVPCVIYGEGKGSYLEQTVTNKDGLHVDSSNVEIFGIRIAGTTGQNQIGGDASGVHAYNSTYGDPHENIRVHDCWFNDCYNGVRLGKQIFDPNSTGTPDTMVAVTDWWVYNNTFRNIFFKGIEVWGDNGFIYDNDIEMGDVTGIGNETSRCIRLVGAQKVAVHHNHLKGHSTTVWPIHVGVNNTSGVEKLPADIDINNNRFECDGTIAIYGDHCYGYLKIQDNICRGSANNETAGDHAFSFRSQLTTLNGTKAIIENLIIEGNEVISFPGFVKIQDGKHDYVRINNNNFISTSNNSVGPALNRNNDNPEDLIYLEFHNNTIITSEDNTTGTLRILATGAAEHYSVKFNSMTENGSLIASSGSGTIDDSLNDGTPAAFSTNTVLPSTVWSDPNA